MSSDVVSAVTDVLRTALAVLTWLAARKAVSRSNRTILPKRRKIRPLAGRNGQAKSERNNTGAGVS